MTLRNENRNLYEVWKSMRQRCLNKKNKDYQIYGGKGVCICPEWNSFDEFYEWAICSGYESGLSIDRINYDGNYCPENCRWANNYDQANNRTNNHYIDLPDRKATVAEISRLTGLSYSTVRTRVNLGWDVDRIIFDIPFVGKNQFSKRGIS